MVCCYVMGFLSCKGIWLYDIPAGDCARRGYFGNWKTWGVDLALYLLVNAYAYRFCILILLNLTQGMSSGRWDLLYSLIFAWFHSFDKRNRKKRSLEVDLDNIISLLLT